MTQCTFLPSNTAVTIPPSKAGAVLSGCPSICAARSTRSSAVSGFPSNVFAPTSPATIHAELEPSPLAIGILFVWRIFNPFIFLPHTLNRSLAEIYIRLFSSTGTSTSSREEMSILSDSSIST